MPDTTTHESMVIWLLLAVIVIAGYGLQYSFKKLFDGFIKRLDDQAQINELFRKEFESVRMDIKELQDTHKHCEYCPK